MDRLTLDSPIGHMELSVSCACGLRDDDIETVGELLRYREKDLLSNPRMRRVDLREIKEVLRISGLQLTS